MAEVLAPRELAERPGRHLDPGLLAQLGRGRLSRHDHARIVRHLMTGCQACLASVARLLPAGARAGRVPAVPACPGNRLDYSAAFASAGRAVEQEHSSLAAERAAAPALLEELTAQPFDRQWTLVVSSPRFHIWALCELLVESSRELGFDDPGRALELAELAAAVAAQLPHSYGPERVNDLAGRAWATLANAERIRSDFRSAEKGFARADRLLQAGTGDPIEKAHMLLLKASLRGNQQRFAEAGRLLDRVVALAGLNGDAHLAGKALITKGFVCGMAARHAEAIRLLERGLGQVDSDVEPRLVVAARHNLILFLDESGRHEEALALLEETRPLYARMGDRMNVVRLRWLEGRIATALGRLGQAEALLREVRGELVSQELGYDAALLSLDFARIYARQGRSAEMRRLAEEMVPIFQSRDIHREAIAALIVFQKAAEMERVTVGLVQELSDYLKKSRLAPGLRLRESL